MTIEEVLSEITKADGNLVVFCGAGISINSGLPAAIPLIDEILDCLEIDKEDKGKLIFPDRSMAMPFEMFIETAIENTNQHLLLDLFKNNFPSTNHFFISKSYDHKLLKEIYTTNFDQLIEQAFAISGKKMDVFCNEQAFSEIERSTASCKLIKVHGSIENADSIRTTLSTITKKTLSREREKVIDRLFATPDDKKRILILGYSCSDIFDIIPKIEKVFDPKPSVYIIEFVENIREKSEVIIENIGLKKDNNPFHKFKGKRIKVNTDLFIQWLWKKIDIDYKKTANLNEDWKMHIREWLESFHAKYLKFSIIGKLFYRIGDFPLALKYHQKALLANDDGYKRGEGASYSNIGLIYHDLKQYDKAIANFEKAASIYPDDFYFGKAAAHTNLGYSYIYVPDKIKALIHFKKSLRISRGEQFRENKKCESDALCNLGLLYEKNREFSNALYYYSSTLDIDREGNILGEAETLSDMARVNKLIGNYKEALRLFEQSHKIAIKIGILSLITYAYEQMEEIRNVLTRESCS